MINDLERKYLEDRLRAKIVLTEEILLSEDWIVTRFRQSQSDETQKWVSRARLRRQLLETLKEQLKAIQLYFTSGLEPYEIANWERMYQLKIKSITHVKVP